MSYRLKLASPGGETRRLTFDAQPLWSTLRAKIADLFGMQNNTIAVSYEDSDGDTVTMSSQEELLDYFQTTYKPGQVAKFTVIDKTQSQRPSGKTTSAFMEEDPDEGQDNGIPTVGPTMIFDVEEGGWQRLPRIPEIFGMHEEDVQTETGQGHAFVEVLDSEAENDERANSTEHTPKNGISTRQLRPKGKEKASPSLQDSRSTSAASIVDNDFPDKSPVHVYKMPDAERSPVASVQEPFEQRSQAKGASNPMGSFGTVYPASPPQDAFKQMPRANDYFNPTGRQGYPMFTPTGSELDNSAMPPSGNVPTIDLEDNSHVPEETNGSRTPIVEQFPLSQPSFVHDVTTFVDNLTHAFGSHPELSEGARNIVKNAVGGQYWNTERDRVAENVRAAAADASSRITEAVGNMTNNAERDAVRVIAEALGGVFRVIGELSSTEPVSPSTVRRTSPVPAPERHDRYSSLPHNSNPQGRIDPDMYRDIPRNHASAYGDNYWPPYSTAQTFGPQHTVPEIPAAQQSSTFRPNPYAKFYDTPVNTDPVRPNVHETKATLEAAKAVYKAEKERFRQEKEERRRLRREVTEKRSRARRVQGADGTIREEEIIARIPFHGSSREVQTQPPRGEEQYTSAQSSAATGSIYGAGTRSVPYPTSSVPGTRTPIYAIADPVPPVPPVPLPAPVTTAPAAPPAPPAPIPPPPPVPVVSVTPLTPAFATNNGATRALGRAVPPQPPQNTGAGSAPGPYSWPIPPVRDPSRRKHLTTLRERIEARLFDMGITPTSQHDMLDILNTCTSRTDAPDDDEVLADVLSAMNIRGSPSPRPGNSGLLH